jgi:hypothetical protein
MAFNPLQAGFLYRKGVILRFIFFSPAEVDLGNNNSTSNVFWSIMQMTRDIRTCIVFFGKPTGDKMKTTLLAYIAIANL